MNARKLGIAIAAATISLGILGIAAPAHAGHPGGDVSWGYSVVAPTGPVTLK
jgi:hypothetical protein